MRFEFCNKLDCPDWILAQLAHASKLNLESFERICILVKRTSEAADGYKLNQQDLMAVVNGNGGSEAFDIDDARACFGAVNFIITNAHSFKVSNKQLNTELEQLGLASEHCQILCNVTNGPSA